MFKGVDYDYIKNIFEIIWDKKICHIIYVDRYNCLLFI